MGVRWVGDTGKVERVVGGYDQCINYMELSKKKKYYLKMSLRAARKCTIATGVTDICVIIQKCLQWKQEAGGFSVERLGRRLSGTLSFGNPNSTNSDSLLVSAGWF